MPLSHMGQPQRTTGSESTADQLPFDLQWLPVWTPGKHAVSCCRSWQIDGVCMARVAAMVAISQGSFEAKFTSPARARWKPQCLGCCTASPLPGGSMAKHCVEKLESERPREREVRMAARGKFMMLGFGTQLDFQFSGRGVPCLVN